MKEINKLVIRNTQRLAIFISFLALESCNTTAKFPISDVTPAAVITVKMKQDKNNNYRIVVTAKNLASAERLSPSENNYVVWIVTESNGIKNLGQIVNKNAKKSYLKTSTPFIVKEIFITAEEKGDISYPAGIEITRTTFSKKE